MPPIEASRQTTANFYQDSWSQQIDNRVSYSTIIFSDALWDALGNANAYCITACISKSTKKHRAYIRDAHKTREHKAL